MLLPALLTSVAALSSAQTVSTAPVAVSTPAALVAVSTPAFIDVVWPKEGARYPSLKRSFTFGSVTPGSTLTINGQPVALRPSGAFLAMVDLGTGTFHLVYLSVYGGASTQAVRSLIVEAPYGASPADFEALRPLEPEADLELRAGDLLTARFAGPAGRQATFDIKGVESGLPMAEQGTSGVYEGHYRIQPEDEGNERSIRFHLRAKGQGHLKGEAAGRLTVQDPSQYRVAVTSAVSTVVKSPPGGYTFFLPADVPLAVTGRKGALLRVELSESDEGFVDADRVQWQPAGTVPPLGGVGRYITVSTAAASTKVHLSVERKLPFEVRQSVDPLSLEVRFYGGMHRVDRIQYLTGDPVVREVLWRQESARVAVFTVNTRLRRGWGYDAYYDGNRFVLEIRRPPLLPEGKSVFRGRRIAVDPGHGPEASAIGPLGTTERDSVLEISERLRAMLEKEGASVYMIRASSMGPPLADRPGLAWKERADLYVSVHANALPVTADPFEAPRGFMVFYYTPQSRGLAEAVQKSYRRNFPELPDESLRWGDLHVCRIPQMPAILTESAYVMLPEQETLLREPRHQERFARTILEGIKDFYEEYRRVQLSDPDEKRAAY